MRLYSFVNANYLKHVQHGIQTAHALHEMYEKYIGSKLYAKEIKQLRLWASIHKTIIVLDGGDCEGLKEIYDFLNKNKKALGLPFSCFHEDHRSLNGALTAVAVVVPPQIYEVSVSGGCTNGFGEGYNTYTLVTSEGIIPNFRFPNSETEQFYELLKSKSLAR